MTFMSVAGTYRVRVKTPMGVQEGRLILQVAGELLKGTIESPAGNVEIANGKVKGNNIEFAAGIRTPFGFLNATVTGTVEGDRFSGIARLPIGTVEIDGVRE